MSTATSTRAQKRTRVSKACSACQRSHLSCDHERPCSRCKKKGIEEFCVDGSQKKRGKKPRSWYQERGLEPPAKKPRMRRDLPKTKVASQSSQPHFGPSSYWNNGPMMMNPYYPSPYLVPYPHPHRVPPPSPSIGATPWGSPHDSVEHTDDEKGEGKNLNADELGALNILSQLSGNNSPNEPSSPNSDPEGYAQQHAMMMHTIPFASHPYGYPMPTAPNMNPSEYYHHHGPYPFPFPHPYPPSHYSVQQSQSQNQNQNQNQNQSHPFPDAVEPHSREEKADFSSSPFVPSVEHPHPVAEVYGRKVNWKTPTGDRKALNDSNSPQVEKRDDDRSENNDQPQNETEPNRLVNPKEKREGEELKESSISNHNMEVLPKEEGVSQ